MAAEAVIETGPNDEGEMFMRPGILADHFPSPYPNEKKARLANNGSLPPDLSLIVKGREGGADYVFSLLMGYGEAPAGNEARPNIHYNRYFAGGWIGTKPPLYDGAADYSEVDPDVAATHSQMAKDVTVFLNWAAEPEHDDRKLMGLKVLGMLSVMAVGSFWFKRAQFAPLKARTFRAAASR